jgi:hypothetical protein
MKNVSRRAKGSDSIRREYDFSSGVRGKFAKRFLAGHNLVLLDPDVAEMFPTSDAVNDALRALVRIAKGTKTRKRSARKPTSKRKR